MDPRQEQADQYIDRLLRLAEKEVIKHYARALKRIRAEIGVMYAQYSQEGELRIAHMTRFNVLNQKQQDIIRIIEDLMDSTQGKIITTAETVYLEAYFLTAFALEMAAGVSLGFGAISHSVVTASVQNPIDKLTLNQRLVNQRSMITQSIRTTITNGLIQGHSYSKMANQIKHVLEDDLKKARRVIRTEAHRNQNAGRLESAKQAELVGLRVRKVWVSTLDDRTRDTHQELDGQEVEGVSGYFDSRGNKAEAPGQFGIASEDINCRCSFIVLTGDRDLPSTRSARDPITGKSTKINYKTYKQWREAIQSSPMV